MKFLVNIVKELIIKVKNNHIDEFTAQCAYFTILAFIPLVILILTLTKYIGIEQSTLFYIIDSLFPSNILNNSIINIVKEVYSKTLGTVTISAIFILWSAGRGFVALCKGLYSAYEIKEAEKYIHFRIKAMICTILFIILILLSLLVLVFGNSINVLLQERFNIFNNFIDIILKAKIIISIIILSIVFTLIYKFIPKHKYKLRYQIPGSIFSAISCNVISIFYSLYVNIFKGFSVMYGSLTSAVLAMMWVYACMYSILLGATINNTICQKMSKNFIKKPKKSIDNL